jgi:hypothetical protein
MGASLPFKFFFHDFAFLFQKDLTKSTMADRSLNEYPQWGQQIRLQFFASRHPLHFIAASSNSLPQRGHFRGDFISASEKVKCQNPNVILRQAQDDVLNMLKDETMVRLRRELSRTLVEP